jgi:hypothetical protein
VTRKTFSKYWRKGLIDHVLYPPQIRLDTYENREEYLYFIQSDKAHKLYKYYQKQPNVVYLVYTLGKFDLVLQTSEPLEVLPDATLLYGSRSKYIYPKTPFYHYITALDKMDILLESPCKKSKIDITYSKEPTLEGSQYGWMIFPYVKYNLRTNYTFIVKKLGISFGSFYKGFEFLLNVSTLLLPYYPLGFPNYAQYFFVVHSQYENLIKEFFGLLPCHTSITKVGNALIIYASIEKGVELKERLFDMIYRMRELGYIDRFWASNPVYYWNSGL